MYIKQVVLEGFKSYAQRTEVAGFDPLFNAITGLNGSGKSNILDAICFLLGITNLSQVHTRACDMHSTFKGFKHPISSGRVHAYTSIDIPTVTIPFSHCNCVPLSLCWQVRAGSLQELVYKGGQAGITRATVTITFDNSDSRQSPLGYESYEEITVSRQVVISMLLRPSVH